MTLFLKQARPGLLESCRLGHRRLERKSRLRAVQAEPAHRGPHLKRRGLCVERTLLLVGQQPREQWRVLQHRSFVFLLYVSQLHFLLGFYRATKLDNEERLARFQRRSLEFLMFI